MHAYIPRLLESALADSLRGNPVTALIGPRQCGKSTLAKKVLAGREDALFLDLELPSNLRKLADPELFLRANQEKLICIDEIQVKADLFPILRALVDEDRRPGRFLLLGSASRDLVRRGGETLAGRIHYLDLTPFLWNELRDRSEQGARPVQSVLPVHPPRSAPSVRFPKAKFIRLWWRGGFPPSFLARGDAESSAWRADFIQDLLYRDIPQLGFSIPAASLRRFWTMLAHYHGGLFNASKIGQSLDVSHNTVRKYLDVLEQSFMVRVLRPVEVNLKKRLIKSPKVYVRDSGVLHSLLEISTMDDLYGHPVFGASWEGWCVEQIIAALPGWRPGFFRTAAGEEIDLVMERGRKRLVFEIKASLSPHLSKGFPASLAALAAERAWVVCPMEGEGYPIPNGARVAGISECLDALEAHR